MYSLNLWGWLHLSKGCLQVSLKTQSLIKVNLACDHWQPTSLAYWLQLLEPFWTCCTLQWCITSLHEICANFYGNVTVHVCNAVTLVTVIWSKICELFLCEADPFSQCMWWENCCCGSQSIAPMRCVELALKGCFAPISAVKGRLHRTLSSISARRLCHAEQGRNSCPWLSAWVTLVLARPYCLWGQVHFHAK